MRPHLRHPLTRAGQYLAALVALVLVLAVAPRWAPAGAAESGEPAAAPKAASASATPQSLADSFVTRCGIRFCLDGKPYYFAGANTYDMFTYGGSYGETETEYMDKARIDAQFTRLQSAGVSVLRLWMFSHEDWHGFEPQKGVYNDQEFALFDYIIQSAKAHAVRLIPVFENYWEAYGGIDTRLEWEGLSGGQPGRAQFFDKSRCPGCFTQYKDYVNYALNRVNHYTGVAYKDEPTIFAWELMNEPRYQDQSAEENVSGKTLRAWVDEMGAYLKGIDPNHMLGTGMEGHESRYGFGGDEGNPFVYIQQSPYIDFTSAHPYPTEEWAGLTLDQTITLIEAWIRDSHEQVGKPFYMGEFNFKNVDRSEWWTAVYNAFEAAGGDGSSFWWYQDHAVDGTYGVSEGAPELAVFRAHSERMAAKSGLSDPNPDPQPTEEPAAACSVNYSVGSSWDGGFQADVAITNLGPAVTSWHLAWDFPGDQKVTSAWNAKVTQSGTSVTAANESYNGTIATGRTVSFGFQGSGTAEPSPEEFTLDGTVCD